jgi:hypothetical protein
VAVLAVLQAGLERNRAAVEPAAALPAQRMAP